MQILNTITYTMYMHEDIPSTSTKNIGHLMQILNTITYTMYMHEDIQLYIYSKLHTQVKQHLLKP